MDFEISIVIPENIKNDLIDSYADVYDYDQTGDGLSKKQFAIMQIKKYIRSVYKKHKIKVFNQDKQNVSIAADNDSETIVVS